MAKIIQSTPDTHIPQEVVKTGDALQRKKTFSE